MDVVAHPRFSRNPPLSAQLTWEGRRAVLALAGELDLATLPVAERALAQARAGGARRLVLDLGGVSFLDVSGLRLIFSAHDEWGEDLRVVGAGAGRDLLAFSGLGPRLGHGRFRRS